MRSRICFSSVAVGSSGKMAFVGLDGHSLDRGARCWWIESPASIAGCFSFQLAALFRCVTVRDECR